uniref:Uncharacterized protein n=1 Tax=Cacopsylla melanoneura TaxID=428564 RepID=A0A8D8YI71_9HEMI
MMSPTIEIGTTLAASSSYLLLLASFNFVCFRLAGADRAELDRLRAAYEARKAAEPTEPVIYSWEFNKSAEVRAWNERKPNPADFTYDEIAMFTNVPASFEPKVSEPYNRWQLWRIFNWYDKDKNQVEDNPYANKYNKVVDRIKWFYKNLVLKDEANGTVNDDRYDRIMQRRDRMKHQLAKVERLKQRLLWYGTPRTTSELSIVQKYIFQETMPADAGKYTKSVSPWFKVHPPFTLSDGRAVFWTDFDGSPEERIPYAHPDWIDYDPRYPLDSESPNLTAAAMDPLPWKQRKKLGGYTNKYLWPPRTTPSDFWRPTRETTLDISEHSDYLYFYDEKNNPRTTTPKNNLDSTMEDDMDSAARDMIRKARKKEYRKRFDEERAELLADNNLTDSDSREKRIYEALIKEVDVGRIIPGKEEDADKEIKDFARYFIGAFGATKKIWFNEDLTMRPVFADNSSRRTVNLLDELYPTICQSHELSYKYTVRTPRTTLLSLETLYDGLDSSDDDGEGGGGARDKPTRQDKVEEDVKTKLGSKRQSSTGDKAAKAVNNLEQPNGETKKRRGRPRKPAEGKVADLKTRVKEGVKRSEKKAKRAKREAEYVEFERTNRSRDFTTNSKGEIDTDTDELTKERMDEEDKQVYKEVMEKMRVWEDRKKNKSASIAAAMGRTWVTKKRRKPTYSYSSKDEEEAERKWQEQAKKKGRYVDSDISIDPDNSKPPHRRRKARSLKEEFDLEDVKRELNQGKTVIVTTNENSTPPYEYFQEKVYPSHNLTSAQLNDEAFCRELLPKLEEDNKFLLAELRRRATEQAEDVRRAQGENDLSEINEDESFEMGLKSKETTATTPMTSVRRRRRRRHVKQNLDDTDENIIVNRRKRAANLTDEEYRAQLQRLFLENCC